VKRVFGGVVAAAAAAVLVPATVFADGPFSGSAGAATLTVSVNPSALVTLPASVVSALPAAVQSQLTATLSQITADVDGAHATGTRSGTGADLSAGHADTTPLSVNLAPLAQLLTAFHGALTTLWGQVTMPALQSTLANVANVTGNSTVMGLLPSTLATELQALNQQLSSLVTDTASSVPTVLTQAVDQLDAALVASLTQGVAADLNSANPNGQSSSSPAVTVPPPVTLPPLVSTAPVLAQLAPYIATAVNAAGAKQFNVSGPQATSAESTTNIAVAPSLSLGSLQTQLAALQSVLQQVKSSIATIEPQLAGVSAIISQTLSGGLDLTTLGNQVDAATTPVTDLVQLAQSLQLNSLLSCNTLGSGSCTITSTSVTPQGEGVHANASSKLVDLSLLQTGSTLATALGTSANTALLDVQGVQATSDAFIDGSNGDQTATSSLAHIAVAGITVVDNGQIDKAALSGHVPAAVLTALPDALPGGQTTTIPVSTPAGTLTVYITLGAPQFTYTGASHRSATLTKMEIKLANGAPDGTATVPDLGLMGAGTMATVDLAAVSSEVLGTSSTLQPAGENGSNVVMEQTGMFGPGSLFVGFGLLVGGVVLRRASRRRGASRAE
jgi:hypothetical protein